MNKHLGHALPRVDGRLKVTGQATYPSDVSLPHMLHAHLVMCTIAEGRIALIDTSAAEAIPGVITVITHENAPRLQPLSFPQVGQPPSSAGNGFLPLQDDRVRFNGQVIAVVVAETPEQASYAAGLVTVAYDREPHQVDMETALHAGFKPKTGGFGEDVDYSRGAVKNGLAEADVTVRPHYNTAINHHNALAPFATVAAWEGDRLTVYDAIQGVHIERSVLAEWLSLPLDKVRVISPFVGGAFGSGLRTNAHSVIAAIAARRVGHPVKLVLTRKQMYTSVGHRPQTHQELTLGARWDGQLTALRHDAVHATSMGDEYVDVNTEVTQMLYACPNLEASTRLVRLNIDTPCPMRAPPQANGVFCLESAMDELAFAVGIDPLELRLRNYADSDPETGLPWSSKSLKDCYVQGAERIGWERRTSTPRSMHEGRYLIGLGVATTTYPTFKSGASASVRIFPDGSALVQSGSADIGPGTYTIMTQIAADTLNIPINQVRFELGDTALPYAPLEGGSMTAASVGSAVHDACHSARSRLAELLNRDKNSPLAGSSAEDLEIVADSVRRTDDPSRSERLADLLGRHGLPHLEAKVKSPGAGKPRQFSSHAFGAHFVKVRVDPDTGEVGVIHFVSTIAAGRILNPNTARSQIIGGITGGIGHALMEQTEFDLASGRIINANLSEYHIPVNADVPDLEVIFIQEKDPHVNPLGAKGIGEIALIGVAPAIANAVFHATGIRIRDFPILPEKLLA